MGAEGSIGGNQALIKKSEELALNHNLFHSNNIIIAGKFKVKHPLMDETLVIFGFIIHDYEINIDDFLIKGLEISYSNKNSFNKVFNKQIYPKLLFDRKINDLSVYMGTNPIYIRQQLEGWSSLIKKVEGDYKIANKWGNFIEIYTSETKFNYYLFSDLISEYPSAATNENVYAVCKYREGGIFKHAIFNFYELIPVDNL